MSLRELALAATLAAAAPAAAAADEPLGLALAVERALAHDVEVRAARSEVGAVRARLEEASSLLAANPELSAAAGPREADDRRTLDWEVALSQRLEVGGQRAARLAASRAALGAAEARLAARERAVAAEVREVLGRVAAAALRAGLAAEAERLAADAAAAADRRLRAGDAARVEVTSARLELGRATRAALEAEQEGAVARAELELLTGAAPGTVREISFALEGAPGAADQGVEALVQEALEARRDLAAARLDVAAADAEARLAGRAAVPSPVLGVSVAREESDRIVLGTLSVDLPLFARNRAERGAATARAEQARAALAALERRVEQEVRLAAAQARAARRVLAALDEAGVAALGDALAVATRAYEAGQLDFVRWLLLRREALDARRDRVDALLALAQAEARLERALGGAASGR